MGTKRGKTCVSILLEKEHQINQWPLCHTCEGKWLKSLAAPLSSLALLLPTAPCQNLAVQFGVMSRGKFLMVSVNMPGLRLCSADRWAASSAGKAVAYSSKVTQVLVVSSALTSLSLWWFSWTSNSSMVGWGQTVISLGFLDDSQSWDDPR